MAETPTQNVVTALSVAAGGTEELTFAGLGFWTRAKCLVKAVLTTGAALTVSAQVRPAANCTDWFDVKVVDLDGTSASALVASVAVAATDTRALLELTGPAEAVKIKVQNTGNAAATVDVWLLTD